MPLKCSDTSTLGVALLYETLDRQVAGSIDIHAADMHQVVRRYSKLGRGRRVVLSGAMSATHIQAVGCCVVAAKLDAAW